MPAPPTFDDLAIVQREAQRLRDYALQVECAGNLAIHGRQADTIRQEACAMERCIVFVRDHLNNNQPGPTLNEKSAFLVQDVVEDYRAKGQRETQADRFTMADHFNRRADAVAAMLDLYLDDAEEEPDAAPAVDCREAAE